MINPNISGDFEKIDSDSVYLSSLVGANYTRSETGSGCSESFIQTDWTMISLSLQSASNGK